MWWLAKRDAATKISLAFGLLMLLLLVVASIAYRGVSEIRDGLQQLYRVEFSNAIDLAAIRGRQNEIRGNVWKILATGDAQLVTEERNETLEHMAEVESRVANLLTRNAADAEFLDKIERYDRTWKEFIHVQQEELLELVDTGLREEALRVAHGPQGERMKELRVLAGEMVGEAEHRAESASRLASENAARTIQWFSLVTGTAIVLGILLGVFISALVRRITREIREGVTVLAASSTEIFASSTQLASGAAEAATAIAETTATVEQVRQTAELSNSKAHAVTDLAQKAGGVALAGTNTIESMRSGILEIREQIQKISEAVLRLSDQTQNIGSIIATVDDLAEQSNLLAVNAAIEAAKAGEQGRGFAVVAQEVRNLAEQSKDATRQVRQVLSDIQKGVSEAGMATDQGSKVAVHGVRQADEAVKAIDQLQNSVAASEQAAIQISTAGQQQLAGMDQVTEAMVNIRDASDQNASASRQVEDAARAIAELGQSLKALVIRHLQPAAAE